MVRIHSLLVERGGISAMGSDFLLDAVEIVVWSVWRWLLVCPGCDVSPGARSTLVMCVAGMVATVSTGVVARSVATGRRWKVLLL